MLDKLFKWGKKKEEDPAISFGRYSDNNKTAEKIKRWTDADTLFKEKKYHESINAFFDYIRDDAAENVLVDGQGTDFTFEINQGSKIVRGKGNSGHVQAEVSLAKMPQTSVPVMRRLLEQNFILYYSRYALDGDRLCMRFDSDIETANPNKLYYAFKELATKADKQDDLLVNDFAALQVIDNEHIHEIPQVEKEIKYKYFQKWITETLDYIGTLDKEKFSGGIAYLLLSLIYRIDFLICPEGALLHELEKINGIYFGKEEKPAGEKNNGMIDAFIKYKHTPAEEFYKCLFRSKSTFAIVAPQQYKTIADNIYNSNNNMIWYRDNNYPEIGRQICEYGIAYCQYSYSLPKPLTDLFLVLMKVNYPLYFKELGFKEQYYIPESNSFESDAIINKVIAIQQAWKAKHPALDFRTQNLKFDNLLNFNHSFTAELEVLNFDSK